MKMAMQMDQNVAMQNAVPKRDTVSSVAGDFDPELERLAKLYNQLERIADHIDGGRPQAGSADGGKLETVSHSLIENLRRKHRDMMASIRNCEEQVGRIMGALGI